MMVSPRMKTTQGAYLSVIVNKMVGALHTLHMAASVPECGKISTTNITNMARARSFVQKVTKTCAAISSTKKATEILSWPQPYIKPQTGGNGKIRI